MQSPFPGMNSYLEEPEIWPSVHHALLAAMRETLVPLLSPHYFVIVELREYEVSPFELELVGVGDVLIGDHPQARLEPNGHQTSGSARVDSVEAQSESGPGVLVVDLPRPMPVRERYLEIRRVEARELVTVIGVLSPTNKRPGTGRQQYERKRVDVAGSLTNLVEIDLLRGWELLPLLHRGALLPRELAGDYRAVVARGGVGRRSELFTVGIRDPLPAIPIPLRPAENEPQVDLQALLQTVYDRAGYDLIVDYRQEPVPPLRPGDASWADQVLREHGLR